MGRFARFPVTVLVALTAAVTGDFEVDYGTYLGGSRWERIQAVFVDKAGAIYVGGSTQSRDFPTTVGAFDRSMGEGTSHGFVAKFTATGHLEWSTFLHGSQRDDVYGIRQDATGNIVVTGWTGSSDFPTTKGAFDRSHNGEMDVFVAKLRADGGALLWSTFIGGRGLDQCRGAMAIDPTGRIYVSGYTESPAFPVTDGAFQRTYAGGQGDAFVARLSSDGSELERSTFVGSDGSDHAFSGVVLDQNGDVTIAGTAGAANFPVTAGAFQTRFGGAAPGFRWPGDAYVARFNGELTRLVFATFVGGARNDHVGGQHSLAADRSGNVYFAGFTDSRDFPMTSASWQSSLQGRIDLFVAAISRDGSRLIGSTYLGGRQDDAPEVHEASGIAVGPAGDVYVSGWTTSGDFPVTGNALQPVHAGGGSDTFLAVFNSQLSTAQYSTFLGGRGGLPSTTERTRTLYLADDGSIVVAGDTNSPDLKLAGRPFQSAPRGGGEAFLFRLRPR